MMPSSHFILCHPLLLLPPIPPSIKVFSNESTLRMRWPNYWSFSFSISPSKEIPGLISFRMDWLDLLAVQGALKSLLQHHSSKASILQHSALFWNSPSFLCFLFCSSVIKLCLLLCDPLDCSMSGFPVLHQLAEIAETHAHGVSDATQPSYPLSSPSPAFSLSQHQGLFQ